MHLIGLFAAIFAALWLWSWTERRRVFRLFNPKPPKPVRSFDDKMRAFTPLILCGGLLVALVVTVLVLSGGR